MPYFYVKVRKNIDICNFLNGYYCRFYGVRGLFQCPPFRGDGREVRKWQPKLFWNYRPPLSPPKAGRTGLSASWESLCVVCPYLECPLEVLLIVFLYNYAVNILCMKSGDGCGFYCMLKQVEIDVQLTSNRKLPNFYEKVTDFLWESYRISKWWQNHACIY